jgi:thioesterase domain-containing protein
MAHQSSPIIFLPGAGGEIPNLGGFNIGDGDGATFEYVTYPGWQKYALAEFTPEALIADLEAQIGSRIPQGPIRIVGYSMGGHFGYAAALRLQANGREIAGFCAIDSFMIESLEPSPGWRTRALSEGLELLRKRRLLEFNSFIRSKFWRAVLRLAPHQVPSLLARFSSLERLSSIVAFDRVFEAELTLHILIRKATPWIQSLDRNPVVLQVPATLLRTRQNSKYDVPWRRRCPSVEIVEIPGQHVGLFSPENVNSLRDAFVAATRDWR